MAGMHICAINPDGSNGFGEWVSVANDGLLGSPLTGLMLTDYTATQQEVHIYKFPGTTTGGSLTLSPGQTAFVFTGHGTNQWVDGRSGKKELHLFMGRSAKVWNNDGDVAYLRKLDGTFVDSLTVGAPARHPNGH